MILVLREIQNYTSEAFAEKVDISAKFLYEIENREDVITTIHEIGDGIAEIYKKNVEDN